MTSDESTPHGTPVTGAPDLDSTMAELETLIENTEAQLRSEGRAPSTTADVPKLTEAVFDVDPDLFRTAANARAGGRVQAGHVSPTVREIGDIDETPRAGGDPANPDTMGDLLAEMKRIVGHGVVQAMQHLKADVISDLKREISAHMATLPPAAAAASPGDAAPPALPNPEDITVTETTSEAIPKAYDPHGIEQARYEYWERAGYFQPHGAGAPYCIMLPPPNVTGSLHMGHAFQDTLMDGLMRYKRMQGKRSLWQCGTDHAGIATQMVVERQLAANGMSRAELGRARFVEAVWRWKGESGGTITRQLRRMGASMDWSRERFTLDDDLSEAVTEAFVRLFDEGLIYRGKRLVNWDPVLHTAISDLEVVSEEENGHLWHIRYPLTDGSGHVVVATTRPETMLGDAAVAVNPQDDRYRRIIGKSVHLPLTDRTIPIIADDYVDAEFGSGCVKITPAHDFNDYAVGVRHQLPLINIFTASAAIGDEAPAAYRGMDRYAARQKIINDLRAQELLARVDDHKLVVPRGDRSHAVIEPYLTDQWFVRIGPLAEPAIKAVEDGRIRFVPENWSKTYFEWMRNIEHWCISRQLWWGHRIPAWYDAGGNVHVGRTEAEARRRGGLAADAPLERDADVLDTWFSSALWPFSTLGWPGETPELASYYPTSVLVTGFDIIFFWVARMIMMGLKFMGDVPFREIYIHGLVRDADGNKMSKSKGNILDPIDLIDGIELEPLVAKRTTGLMRPEDATNIEQATRRQFAGGIPGHGTDALRFTFAAMATQGRDIRFDLGRIQGYRNFCNKIWNASRYVLMTCAQDDAVKATDIRLGMPEHWIVTRLQTMLRAVREGFDSYRFDLASQALYEFMWNDYCDWYIELAKITLGDDRADIAHKRGTRAVLLEVLETFLRALHPIMPFITDEVWLRVAPLLHKGGATIMLQPYPNADASLENAAACAAFEWTSNVILGVRRIRAENNIESGKKVTVLVRGGSAEEWAWLGQHAEFIRRLGRVGELRTLGDEAAPDSATALAGATTILVPLAGLIDPAAEIRRLEKELERLDNDLNRTRAKLGNEAFLAKAPPAVVDKERDKREQLTGAMERLQDERRKLLAMRAGDWAG